MDYVQIPVHHDSLNTLDADMHNNNSATTVTVDGDHQTIITTTTVHRYSTGSGKGTFGDDEHDSSNGHYGNGHDESPEHNDSTFMSAKTGETPHHQHYSLQQALETADRVREAVADDDDEDVPEEPRGKVESVVIEHVKYAEENDEHHHHEVASPQHHETSAHDGEIVNGASKLSDAERAELEATAASTKSVKAMWSQKMHENELKNATPHHHVGGGATTGKRAAGLNAALGGGTDRCSICEKTVYAAEKVLAGKGVFHRQCFKCAVCKITLRTETYEQGTDGALYCKRHYGERFNNMASNSYTASGKVTIVPSAAATSSEFSSAQRVQQ